MTNREIDIVLFGATGFVGRLTADHLATAAPPGTRIALAARSMVGLEQLRAQLAERAADWELVEVNAADGEGLSRLAGRTRVLATTVGPYARFGKEVARAAAEQGTHYADLTGELLFVRWSIQGLTEVARRTGARIVHSCGFDSVPSDLGVWLTARQAGVEGQGTLTDTQLVVRKLRGGVSGGTIDSLRQQMITVEDDPGLRRVLSDRYALSPRRAEEPEPVSTRPGRGGRRRAWLRREPGTRHWFGPFVMAGYNTRVVRLSNTLTDWSYGRDFRYREVSDYGSGPAGLLRAAGTGVALAGLAAAMSRRPSRALLDRVLPRPGQGPSAAKRAAGRYHMEITANTTTGARYRVVVADHRDPGYDGTAVLLGETALGLAADQDQLPDRAGVLTPAVAMGEVLAERLRAQGLTIDLRRVG